MKSVTRYACEKCGVEFKTSEEAIECEKSHAKPMHVRLPDDHKTPQSEIRGIPVGVIVDFDNGKSAYYDYNWEHSSFLNKQKKG